MLFVGSVVGILLTFIISFQSWLINDDFLFIFKLREVGVMNFLKEFYLTWDGRQMTPAAIFQAVFELYLFPEISVPIYLLFFYFSIWIFFDIVFKLNYKNTIIVSFFFFFSIFPFLKNLVYWQNGGIYSLFIFQSVLLLYIFHNNKIRNIYVLVFVSFLLSLNSQNLFIPLFIFILCKIIYKFIQNKVLCKRDLLIIFSMIIGVGIVSFAPGNFIRISNQTETYSVSEILRYLPELYFSALRYAKYPFLAGFVLFLYLGSSLRGFYNNDELIRMAIIFCSLAFLSILIFAKYPGIAYPRSLFVFSFLFFPFGAFIGAILSDKLSYYMKSLPTILVCLTGILFFSYQLSVISKCSNRISERNGYLLSKSGSNDIVNYEKITCSEVLIFVIPSQEPFWRPYIKSYYNIDNLNFE